MLLTERQLLAGIGRQREAKQRHRCDQHARHDQIEEIVERFASNQNRESDVDVRLGAAIVVDFVAFAGNTYAI